jgi:thiosulfate sulfurtransferase
VLWTLQSTSPNSKFLLSRGFGPLIVDVRRNEDYAESNGVIPGAIRRDPETVATWWRDLDLARPIVVHCVHGHEVSQATTAVLREHGFPARYLEGGFEGWTGIGGPSRQDLDCHRIG